MFGLSDINVNPAKVTSSKTIQFSIFTIRKLEPFEAGPIR